MAVLASLLLSLVTVCVVVYPSTAASNVRVRMYSREKMSTMDTPYGIHIAFGNGGVEKGLVRVLWASARQWQPQSMNNSGMCEYGTTLGDLQWRSTGRSYTYSAGNFKGTLHEVTLDKMPTQPGATVYYRCGSNSTWSGVLNFTVQEQNVTESTPQQPWVGAICDMGLQHSDDTVASIGQAVRSGLVQAVVHGGDISYANDYDPSDNNSYVWQEYMQKVSQFAAQVPYMTCPGNHESQFSFAAYLNWLPMPNISGSPFYHSFDYMGIHFLMFSTEHDFTNGSVQHQWIVNDLKQANANRETVPWVVVIGHRPLYCTDLVLSKRCDKEAPVYRSYLEDVLHDQNVDVYISGHNHQYERTYPVYKVKATQKDYVNPKATVYIVDGAAGSREMNDPSFLPKELAPWRAHHSELFGRSWLRMRASKNSFEFQLVASSDSKVIDNFTITRS